MRKSFYVFGIGLLLVMPIGWFFGPKLVDRYPDPTPAGPSNLIPIDFNSTLSFQARKDLFLNLSSQSENFYAQSTRIYLGQIPNEAVIEDGFASIYEDDGDYDDCADFHINSYLRMLYLNNRTDVMSPGLVTQIKGHLLDFKYWIDEPVIVDDAPSSYNMYFWTENHMNLFHTAELLVGQYYRNETFTYSGMTGQEHIDHALPLVNQWLDWRGKYGFSEWCSNIYYSLDFLSLFNLIEFAENETIRTKASMVVDLMAFEFVNSMYQGRFATAHGRSADDLQYGTSAEDPAHQESPATAAWLMLGSANINAIDAGNRGGVSLATSDNYVVPPILEAIANATQTGYESKARSGLSIADGPQFGIPYDEEHLMYWWGASAPAAPEIIDATLAFQDKYGLSSKLIFNDALFKDVLNIGTMLSGGTISDYAERLSDITRGVALESVSTYTYRTPHYQLSGAQDYQKGMNGIQEHLWQATLGNQAFVYTNSPGGVSPYEWVGGWKPRATMYQNVGIFQYDRKVQDLLGETVILYLKYDMGRAAYTHAYFPQWAFDDVQQVGRWTFGQKDGGFIALYSANPAEWVDGVELRSGGCKNAYIVELGSVDEYTSFEAFINAVSSAAIDITQLGLGYQILYDSPSQGEVEVSWDGDMYVDGTAVDLGPYPRFENAYCTQPFGSNVFEITYGGETLTLNFENATRTTSPSGGS